MEASKQQQQQQQQKRCLCVFILPTCLHYKKTSANLKSKKPVAGKKKSDGVTKQASKEKERKKDPHFPHEREKRKKETSICACFYLFSFLLHKKKMRLNSRSETSQVSPVEIYILPKSGEKKNAENMKGKIFDFHR